MQPPACVNIPGSHQTGYSAQANHLTDSWFSLATPCQRPPRLQAVFRVTAKRDLAAVQAGDFAHQVEAEATLEMHLMQRHTWRHWRNCGIHSTSRQGRRMPLPRIPHRRHPGSDSRRG